MRSPRFETVGLFTSAALLLAALGGCGGSTSPGAPADVDDDFPLPLATGLAPTPPMGWNSWNEFQGNINEKLINSVADAFVANGLKDAGYTYVNIDDTWSNKTGRAADGSLQADGSEVPQRDLGGRRLRPRRRAEARDLRRPRHRHLRRLSRLAGSRDPGCDDVRRLGRRLPEVRQLQRHARRQEAVPDDAGRADRLRTAVRVQPVRLAVLRVGRHHRESLANDQRHRQQLELDLREPHEQPDLRGLRGAERLERSRHAGGRRLRRLEPPFAPR